MSMPVPGSEQPGLPCEFDELMALYQQGSEQAARSLIHAVSPLLFRFFLRYPQNRDHAADLLQETWLRIHKVRHTYRTGEPVLPWIYAIARHVRSEGYRRRRRILSSEQAMDVVPESSFESIAPPRVLPGFDSLMEVLPPGQREVITMLKLTGMSLEDVARATSSSVGAVKQKAHRAYRKLREVIEQFRDARGPLTP